jgi:hypothetical protein
MENELALFGGKPLISRKLEPYKTIVERDFKKVEQILKSGNLSNFLGTKGNNFLGGEYVNKFEKLASEVFQVDHVVTFNSWTSGLVAMTGAIELEPGDEVILMKNQQGEVIGFEKLNYTISENTNLKISLETAIAT